MKSETERASFPAGGAQWEDLSQRMAEFSAKDIDWRGGRAPMFVFKNDATTQEIGQHAYMMFFTENALGGGRAFHGIGRMEREVLDYGLDLLQAPEGAKGVFTPGGSESIFLAVKAARESHRARAGAPRHGLNMVMPDTAHAAFDKAAQVMDLEIRRAPLTKDKRVDPEALRGLIDDHTMLIVGSAPCYPHGVIDPVDALSAIALERGIWLHVDACVGGWILPFYKMNGAPIRTFDFSLPGVRSISADLHKFGFCPKPASTVFFRDQADQERSAFVADQWPAGVFRTTTLAGTRPAGAVAAAWAVLNHLGTEGYRKAAARMAAMTDAYVADITAIEGMEFWAQPDMTLINFGSRQHDMMKVAAAMMQKDWLVSMTRRPVGLHVMMSLLHEGARAQYITDLRAAVLQSHADTPAPQPGATGYA